MSCAELVAIVPVLGETRAHQSIDERKASRGATVESVAGCADVINPMSVAWLFPSNARLPGGIS